MSDHSTKTIKRPKTKTIPTERVSKFSTSVDTETLEFIKALESYKAEKGRAFPSWSEVLQIVKKLGYRRTT
ncbi:MAG TPA: hypothetical protein PKA37_06340 [Planctomycetota bacterium]|jgi:hypothetical protein|nr:hypothetical protein [Planctomycetota bacterium]